PGQPATSGATSLLYPVLLAVGYVAGFQGERLVWWALGIGVLTWIGSAFLVFSIILKSGTAINPRAKQLIGFAVTAAFLLTGSLGWAFMSGMETGLLIFAVLLTLWYAVNQDRRGVILAGSLTALIRPEGLIIGVSAVIFMAMNEASRRDVMR